MQDIKKIGIVCICVCTEASERIREQFLYGMEEEAVPACILSDEEREDIFSMEKGSVLAESSAFAAKVEIAYLAAERSFFHIGVYIDDDVILVHHDMFTKDTPVLIYQVQNTDSEKIRKMGQNAARLVKNNILKAI